MKTFAIGDIHGNMKALIQCIERSGFKVGVDTLIGLGDYADGYPETAQVVDYLLKLPNFIGLMGNHDFWTKDWLNYGRDPMIWTQQGGKATQESYLNNTKYLIDQKHKDFFNGLHYYYVDLDRNFAFVHAGWESEEGLGHDHYENYIWNRKLIIHASNETNPDVRKYAEKRTAMYDRVFLGHTVTFGFNESDKPMKVIDKIWNLDTGAGWNGRLTIMDIDTEEYWQSDSGEELYGPNQGRGTFELKKRK